MKVVQKDGDRFPELVAEVHERIIAPGHAQAARRCSRECSRSAVSADRDPRAFAAVALGALVGYRIEETMFGAPPGEYPEDDFIEAWVDTSDHVHPRCDVRTRRSDGTHRGEEHHATARMANWYTRRSYGRDTEIAGVMAHSQPNFRGYGMFECFHERSHARTRG